VGESDRPIAIVDADNRAIGEATRSEMHVRQLWHRACHCIVHDGRGRIYLSQRDDVVCRDRWDVSLTEHLRAGESFEQCAERGLARRLGVSGARPRPISEVFADRDLHDGGEEYGGRAIADYRFMQLFALEYAGPIGFDRRVYKAGQWHAIAEVDALIASDPERFTPHFRKDWLRIRPVLVRGPGDAAPVAALEV
jgi:isopentenyl-diphosphate delta-isomerase